MSGGGHSAGKRQREQEKARKKRRKLEEKMRKRALGPSEIPITTVDEVTGDLEAIDRQRAAERAAAPAGARAIPSRLFVGSLSWNTTEDDLREAFGKFGRVSDAVVICDRDTGRSRGFGFVVMQDRKDATKAIEQMHESELDGRTIVVNVATERSR